MKKPGIVKTLVNALTPRAPMWAHYLMAALLWTGVGCFLLYRGVSEALLLEGGRLTAVALGAAAVGAVKGFKVMRPAARKGADRIAGRGDDRCLGGFISFKTWALVIAMGIMGKFLRSAHLPHWLLGFLLGGVGTALLLGSVVYWQSFVSRISYPDPTP